MSAFIVAVVTSTLDVTYVQLTSVLLIHDDFVTLAKGVPIYLSVLFVYLF